MIPLIVDIKKVIITEELKNAFKIKLNSKGSHEWERKMSKEKNKIAKTCHAEYPFYFTIDEYNSRGL